MKNHLAPDYLRTILPPPHGHYSGYPTRYSNNYIVPLSRTTKHHESFIPKSTRGWNSLDEQLKSCNILHSFKTLQKKKLFPTKFQHLSNGKGKHSINHTRMRLGLSHLRQQLHSFKIIDSPYCTHCTDRLETTTHYLLTCPKYTDIILFKISILVWSGTMQLLHRGDQPSKSSALFLPMIDLSSSDTTCINSTLNDIA